MKTALSLLACLALLSGLAAPSAADTSKGAQLAATCASCHGPDGSAEGIPALAGRDEQAIITAMTAYKASERPSHVMHAIALALSEEELASVARHLAGQDEDQNPP